MPGGGGVKSSRTSTARYCPRLPSSATVYGFPAARSTVVPATSPPPALVAVIVWDPAGRLTYREASLNPSPGAAGCPSTLTSTGGAPNAKWTTLTRAGEPGADCAPAPAGRSASRASDTTRAGTSRGELADRGNSPPRISGRERNHHAKAGSDP